MYKKKSGVLIICALLVVALDQWTKYVVRTDLDWQYFDIVKGWLAVHYIQNPGMALGIDWLPTQVIGYITLIAILGISWQLIKWLQTANWGQAVCYGLIIGGAIGNIFDRMFMGLIQGRGGFMNGHVVDFIHFNLEVGGWPVFPYIFNVADVAISFSIIAMLVFYKKLMPHELRNKPKDDQVV